MIVFLSLAPIEFMGGFEVWVINISKSLRKKEDIYIINLCENIANFYGKLVLKRKFEKRYKLDKSYHLINISLRDFIPWSKNHIELKNIFKQARLIYLKFELIEVLLLLYFGGYKCLCKSIAGIHSRLIYNFKISFFDRLHKLVYESKLCIYTLSKFKRVHLVNITDYNFLSKQFKLRNIRYIPNGIQFNKKFVTKTTKYKKRKINVLYLGELNLRKGTDILINLIKASNNKFFFNIVGDGPLIKKLKNELAAYDNWKYFGYVNHNSVNKFYKQNDIFILPSRAEGMSLSLLEAMAFGLYIIDTKDISIQLPQYIETSLHTDNFIYEFKKYSTRIIKKLDKSIINKYFLNHFESKIVNKKLINYIFN